MIKTFKLLLAFICIAATFQSYSQDTSSSDGLFQAARKAAFDEKNYSKAKAYLYKALKKSPNYSDIRIFLGRIYTWNDNYDSAKYCFEFVLNQKPEYEDASIAYFDLEYWNDHNAFALTISNKALKFHPKSEDLLIRNAKVNIALRKYADASTSIDQILLINKSSTEARSLASRIKDVSSKNKIGFSYDYTNFDKQFADPWHLTSIDYSRSTKLGSIAARVNMANRFKTKGVQYEIDAYPHISKTFYSYISAGYSDDGIFPNYRAGFSLYANLPKSFEAEAGVRYLYFGENTWIYTGYLGKYYKSWLFNARTYITPALSNMSHSYSLGARYYYSGGADEFIWLSFGTGISPDERANTQLLNSNYKLISKRASLTCKFNVGKMNSFTLSTGWVNQEYLKDTKGNQVELGLAYTRRF